MYFTSRKKRFAQLRINAQPIVKTIRRTSTTIDHKLLACTGTPTTGMTTATITRLTARSVHCAITDATGMDSRGKYTLPMRFACESRLCVAVVIAPEKKAHGTAFTVSDATLAPSMGLFDSV